MSVTGILLRWRRRKAGPNIRHNSPAHAADSVILVGSESNSTWGFAKTLHDTLHAAGHRVHSTDEQLCD
jgi:sulfite reductase (NADPH) flavoprotein alpha-component